jgi:tripartite-type tricarboxylate transporter receptor subunit TctC
MKLRVVLALAIALATSHSFAQWKPNKPINIIVPWAAGGATDQVTRVAAGELEEALGTKIVVINQPGASGSIGTMSALNAPRDGYTWTAGAPKQLGTYPVLGLAGTKLGDFHLFVSVTQVPIVSVNPNSPYQSFQQLLDDMKAKPGQITIATAGNTSSGHIAAEAIARRGAGRCAGRRHRGHRAPLAAGEAGRPFDQQQG